MVETEDPKTQRRIQKLMASLDIPADTAAITLVRNENGAWVVDTDLKRQPPRRTTRRKKAGE